MNNTIKSIILIFCFVAIGVLGYMFYPLVFETIMGNKYYTSQQAQDLYDKGFSDGNNNKTELEEKNTYFETLVNEYYSKIDDLNKELEIRKSENELSTKTIEELSNSKQELENEVASLTTLKQENEEQISSLNEQIIQLQKRIDELLGEKHTYQNEITNLRNQVANLQKLNAQLQRTNELNAETITTLNTQISSLNTQISNMTMQVQNNSSIVSNLNNRISELEKSVAYYEQYISSLETNEQVVVTFEFNGSIYNIQVLNKGAKASVITPTSTDKVIFNFWQINTERIDLNSYTFNENTKITANITLKQNVQFSVDNEITSSQFVVKGTNATLPLSPTKQGYVFDGWTINGVDLVDISSYEITSDIIFYAKFTKLHTVTFIYESENIETLQVKNGEFATAPSVEGTRYKVFKGWLVNNASVNVSEYKITADTVFIASITYFYDVNFKLDSESEEIYSTLLVERNHYVPLPENPTKDGYSFDGWSLDNENILDLSNYEITSDVTFIAMFSIKFGYFAEDGSLLYTWQELMDNEYLTYTTVGSSWTVGLHTSNKFNELPNGKLSILETKDITLIGQYAFSDCQNLIEIEVPNSVTEIRSSAFSGCKNLTKVKLSNTITAIDTYLFQNCSSLQDIILPESIINIYSSSFSGCSSLTSIEIPKNVSKVYGNNFVGCSNLTNLSVNTQNTKYDSRNNCNAIIETETNTLVLGCDNSTIPQTVSIIGESAFKNASFETITISANVLIIKANAFENTGLTSITIPSNVQTIGNSAFASCKNLTNLVIENGVSSIGQMAFSSLPITSITIPGSVKELSYAMFGSCRNLVEVTLLNGVTTVGDRTFWDCQALEKITFSSTVTTIGENAFLQCTGLRSIYLPATITTIRQGNYRYSPFFGCSSSLVIYCEKTTSDNINFLYGYFWNSYVTDGNCDPWEYKNMLAVKCGYSYEQYLNAIGG